MGAPMVINFYGKDNEVEASFTRSFVPWKLLKVAIKLSKSMDSENMSEEDADALGGLVVAVFGDQFSTQDLDDKADVSEMIAVLQQIVATAGGKPGNPTPPGS